MASGLLYVAIAWLVYSLGSYGIHRAWHYGLRRGVPVPGMDGEKRHHVNYDRPRRSDPYYLAIHPPGGVVAVGLVLAGLPLSVVFAVSLAALYAVDELAHYEIHLGTSPDWLVRRHRLHHERYHGNYAILVGIVWDYIFRSNLKGPL